jgi:hypothetical protein
MRIATSFSCSCRGCVGHRQQFVDVAFDVAYILLSISELLESFGWLEASVSATFRGFALGSAPLPRSTQLEHGSGALLLGENRGP